MFSAKNAFVVGGHSLVVMSFERGLLQDYIPTGSNSFLVFSAKPNAKTTNATATTLYCEDPENPCFTKWEATDRFERPWQYKIANSNCARRHYSEHSPQCHGDISVAEVQKVYSWPGGQTWQEKMDAAAQKFITTEDLTAEIEGLVVHCDSTVPNGCNYITVEAHGNDINPHTPECEGPDNGYWFMNSCYSQKQNYATYLLKDPSAIR